MKSNTNPFRAVGSIVSGDDFVGREQEIFELKERVIGHPLANAQIIGLPKIGKSSLMNVLKNDSESLWNEDNCIVLWYTLKDYSDPGVDGRAEDVFTSIISETIKYLKRKGKSHEDLNVYAERAAKEGIRFAQFEEEVKSFFDELTYLGYRIILCIDEFDYSRDVFSRVYYQLLREISYEKPDVGIVTTSRRTILDIEKDSGGGSSFHETCLPIDLKQFSDLEIVRLRAKAGEISEEDEELLDQAAGNHPYLNALILRRYWGSGDMASAIDDSRQEIFTYYSRLFTRVLKRDGLDDKVMFIYCGFLDAVTQEEEIYITQRYGLFKACCDTDKTGLISYVPFCESFDEYMRMFYRNCPYGLVWPRAERSLRMIISESMKNKYGNKHKDWLAPCESLVNSYFPPKPPKSHYKDLKRQMDNELRNYPVNGSDNIIDQLYPKDYIHFLRHLWNDGVGAIMSRDISYWQSRLDFISNKIRNPEMHSRRLIDDEDKNKASLICNEIIACAEAHFGPIL